MSCIHYKFKSSLDYNSVTFDGLHLSLSDLKKAISQQKRLKPGEFDLEITNAQTGDVYKKNDELIAKNTSVIVSRVPVNKTTASSTQKSWEAFKQECAKVKEKERQKTLDKLKQPPDAPTHAPVSEMDKIKAVIDQSTKGFEPSNFVGKYQPGVPHDSYVCKLCSQKGHFVTNCPNSNPEDRYIEPRYKRTTGIPSTMLTIVDDPMHPGALLTHHGQFAVPTVDVLGYRDVKKERPPFLPEKKDSEPEKKKIPQELLCHICEDLCVDAAIAPCCGTSFCDECLRDVLLESDDHKCPSCKETNVSPDKIVPNRSMRLAVTNFLNDTGYTKAKKRRSSSQNSDSFQAPTPTKRPPSPVKHSFRTNSNSAPNLNSLPSYNQQDSNQLRPLINNVPTQSFPPRMNVPMGVHAQFHPQYSYTRPPRFPNNQFSKPWRFSSEPQALEGNTISTISRRNNSGDNSSRPYADEPPPASQNVDTTEFSVPSTMPDNDKSSSIEPFPPKTPAMMNRTSQASVPPISQHSWPTVTSALLKTPPPMLSISNTLPLLALGAVLNARQPMVLMPPHGQPYPTGFPHGFQGHRPGLPMIPPPVQPTGVPLSREEFYKAKKMFETAEVPEKKPVDVFESFADFAKRKSRSPERRRSYSRSRSRSWSKRGSRSPSISPGKRRSRSLSPRRFTTPSRSRSHQRSPNRSRSKSGLRSQNRSRSRSGPRPANRSRSRSFESSRLPPHRPQTHSLTRVSKSRSRSRSIPRVPKVLTPTQRPSISPLRRSPKSPLPPLRSRSRSFGRLSRSRSKSWSKRARSRSYSRPRSPRPLSRSPRRLPRSPYRSPFRKRSPFSPRRRSNSFSPHRRSALRSRSRTPPPKRKFSKSRTRSPFRRRSYTPRVSPRRSKSPYKKPLSPIPFKRHSPSPFRGRGGYRGRGRGGYGYRDNRDKFRNYRSPPRTLVPQGSNTTLSTGNLPPVPYFPQMGLPPPEEYFKYNPDGYQEFVRSFYAQLGPQTQTWAQNQTFPLLTGDRFPSNIPGPNIAGPNQRPAWEPVPMSPSHRPRSLTPPEGGQLPRDKKDQPFNKDRDSHSNRHWEKERERPDHDRDRTRDRRPERGRGIDTHRDRDRADHIKEDDRHRFRDYHRDRDNRGPDNRGPDNSRNIDRPSERRRSPARKSKDEDKSKDKGRKKYDKIREEKEPKKTKKTEVETKKENTDIKENIMTKPNPATDKNLETTKTEQKPVVQDTPHTKNEPRDKLQVVNAVSTSEVEPTPAAESSISVIKPPVKEKKNVGKKKGDGVGGKKKIKDATTEDGGDKKVKKTKKKKLTFGASDIDPKQGLKKKKLKRLVDYKSENCTSEDGEERAPLGSSPLKKAKLAEINQIKDEPVTSVSYDKVDIPSVAVSEPTFEISTEIKHIPEINTVIKQETETVVAQFVSQPPEEKVPDKKNPDLPELSKWERDEDFDYFDPAEHAKEKPQEKIMLPRSVVDKAEKFLTHKPMKNAVMVAHVTTSTRSPEPAPEKNTIENSSSPSQSKSSRRVFIDHKQDSKEKKQGDLQITVKTDKRKEYTDRRGPASRSDDHRRHHYYHHHEHDGYEEDQRSVVKSCSLERELHDSKTSSRTQKDRDGYSRKDRFSHGNENNTKQDSSRRDRSEPNKDRHRDKSPEQKEKRHDRESSSVSHPDTSKSSKDLRHKLEEKNKTKSAVDQRKLSVMDESEFVPDYEDLGPEGTNDNEHDDATASQNSEASTSETNEHKVKKTNKDDDNEKGDENKLSSEEAGKIKKSKKKHKHKEKKEKHKHKKKKHKHKKGKEGKQKTNKDDASG